MLPHETSVSPKQAKTQEPIKSLEQPGQSTTLTQQRAHQLLNQKDYIGTINLIQNEILKGADEQAFAKEYLQAANSSLIQADTLANQGYYSKSALLLRTVQDSYPKSSELQQQITSTPAQIAEKIDLCTEELMEAGLVAYRSGEFSAAIDVWTQVLELNPRHQAAQNSIQTTQLQLSNLKTLDSKE
jgi:tetratricopeptide (TPR) repeat protein